RVRGHRSRRARAQPAGGTVQARRPLGRSSRGLSFLLPAPELPDARLPVPAVERSPRERRQVDVVEAAHVDVDAVGVGARHVEARHTAVAAEMVLRDTAVEAVGAEVVGPGKEPEGVAGHDPVQVALAGADRTVAVAHLGRCALHLEAHPAAVAAARRGRHPGMLETATGSVNAWYNDPVAATAPPPLVVLGAGFAGLRAIRILSRGGQRMLWVDGRNYHTFLPLLYQVATAGLEPQAIVYPTRSFLRRLPGVDFRLARIVGGDPSARTLRTADGEQIAYDYLLVATGGAPAALRPP